jgi:hypothetical protein
VIEKAVHATAETRAWLALLTGQPGTIKLTWGGREYVVVIDENRMARATLVRKADA